MDEFPDEVVLEILDKINITADRISTSLTCKRFHELNNEHRKSIRLVWNGNRSSKELLSLCKRFQYLREVEIFDVSRDPQNGEYLDEISLYNLSISCPLLADLTLRNCLDITDTGLSHLASCSNLSRLKLTHALRITDCGMWSVVVGCRKLASIHLISCFEVVGLDWLGGVEKLEELCIRDCKAIEEGDLIKLGPSWQTLKRLQFKQEVFYAHRSVDNLLMNVGLWESIPPCDNMLELVLVSSPYCRGGLSSILGKCRNLEKIRLERCAGVDDSDIMALAQNSTNLRTISLRAPRALDISSFNPNHTSPTDESLKALALNCPRLESIQLEFPNSFSIYGILDLVRMYPIRELILKKVHSFGDAMQALRGAESLEMLELIDCDGIRDEGIHVAAVAPRLRVLKIDRCYSLTDNAFEPFRGRRKLEVLAVSCCPSVSKEGVKGAADSVSFSQDQSPAEYFLLYPPGYFLRFL